MIGTHLLIDLDHSEPMGKIFKILHSYLIIFDKTQLLKKLR